MTTVGVVRRRDAAFAAALIFVWLAVTAWARPLALPDEGRYVGVAWEMLRSGDWLTPTLNGLPFFHKPPLFYWLTAGSMKVFGVNEWAARIASVLGAWTGAFAVYCFVQRWSGTRAARLTLVALLAQPLYFVGAQFANLDMLVAGFITASTLLFVHAALNIEVRRPYRRALTAAYAMAALGVLTKGLIGAVIPSLVLVCWLVSQRRWASLRSLLWLPGLASFLLLCAPWFIATQARYPDFLHYFFVVQHFTRFAGSGFNSVEPVWFYPAILLGLSLPWWPWLYRAVVYKNPVQTARIELRWLLWIWLAVVVIFFSIPKSKLLGYVLPALPPLACLIADGYLRLTAPSVTQRRIWWGGAVLGLTLCLGTVAALSTHPRHSSRQLAEVLRAKRGLNEPVFMLHHYYYDVAVYARLEDVVSVVEDWTDPELSKADDWRKELVDAARFARERSAKVLLAESALANAVCASPVSWVIGYTPFATSHRFLNKGIAVFQNADTTLWRLDLTAAGLAAELNCAGGAIKP